MSAKLNNNDDSSSSEDEQEQGVTASDSEPLVAAGSRVESGYPTGFVPHGAERLRMSDGAIKTRDGTSVCIPTKCAIEFIATMFLFFFGTLGSVNSSAVAVHIATTLTGVGNTNASMVYQTAGQGHAVIANPLSTFLAAVSWGTVLFMTLRAFPGVAVNPWVSWSSWFFQQNTRAGALKFIHYVHTVEETVWVVLSQLLGGIIALMFVYLVQGRDTALLGETLPSELVTRESYIILYEGAASFLFYTLITLYSRPRRDVSALEQAAFISISLFFIVMCFGPFTGASVSAVHTLAPAIVRSMFDLVPIRSNVGYYCLGQAIGFFAAGALNYFINKTSLLTRIRCATTAAKED
jgi:glycerol uptake facilitator-like aquaporin